MKEKLYQQLVFDYPELFQRYEFNIAVPNGWYVLLSNMFKVITAEVNSTQRLIKFEKDNNESQDRLEYLNAKLIQAKNELPTILHISKPLSLMRILVAPNTLNDRVSGIIAMTQTMSGSTCELCGNQASDINTTGKTLCKMHMNESENAPVLFRLNMGNSDDE